MTVFGSRERAFEAKYAHDGEFRFLVTARRDRPMAHLVAERLGMAGTARYALTAAVLKQGGKGAALGSFRCCRSRGASA